MVDVFEIERKEALLVKEQIEKAEFMRQHLQPELNQICNLIITILKRCPLENKKRVRSILSSDLNWWVNEADIDDRVATIETVVSDQGNGGSFCGFCDIPLNNPKLDDCCPNCGAIFKSFGDPYVNRGSSDY